MTSQEDNFRAAVAIPKGTKQEELDDLQWYFIPGDDLEQHFKDVFEPQLGEIYFKLFLDVSHTYEKWAVVKQIYSSTSILSRLDQNAKRFVFLLLEIFGDDLILSVARLTDKPQMGSARNLSLLTTIDFINNPNVKSVIPLLINDAKAKAEKARMWRNKSIAHRDKKVLLSKRRVDILPPLDDRYVEEALAAAGEVLTQLYGMYSGNPIEMKSWEPTGTIENVDSFLRYIKFSLFCMNDDNQGKHMLNEFDAMERVHLYR